MFVHYRSRAFVLKKTDRGEADQVFTVFTQRFGALKVLAKSVRKISSKLRGGAPLFSISEIEFIQGKAYKTLTDAILVEDFENVKKDLARLKIAFKISEVFDQLVKAPEREEKIWQLLREVFQNLNSLQFKAYSLQLLYYYFLWNLLSILGYQPELYKCLICGEKLKPENLFFCQGGGIVCSSCYKKKKLKALKIDPNIVKILREIFKKNFRHLSKLKIKKEYLKPLKKISDFYLSVVLENFSYFLDDCR